MKKEESIDSIDQAISSITKQINFLSSRCKLEENKKNIDFNKVLEASSLMLQLSRSLNELIVTSEILKKGGSSSVDFLQSFIEGKRS